MATKMSITEGLAEIKTISKRLEKKAAAIQQFTTRRQAFVDPLEKTGGSKKYVEQELQSVGDLLTRVVQIRTAIAHANDTTKLKIGEQEMTISEWLVWRREVAPKWSALLTDLVRGIDRQRSNLGSRSSSSTSTETPADLIVNVDEQWLAKQVESITEVLGVLDGRLSLLNATVMIDLP